MNENKKNIISFSVTWFDSSFHEVDEISIHRTTIHRREKEMVHQLYNGLSEEPAKEYKYEIETNECQKFFEYLENAVDISSWEADYTVQVMDGWSWEVVIEYLDNHSKRVIGTVMEPPYGEEIQMKILQLADFKEQPLLFG